MNSRKSTRKITALLLAAMMTALMLASCGGDTATDNTSENVAGETTAAAPETTTMAFDTIERADYNGATFHIVSNDQDDRQDDVLAEEENGDTLNDLVYRRNALVEETFNITITAEGMGMGDITTNVQNNTTAGDNPYDLILHNTYASSLITGGYLTAWNDVDSIDFTQPWWDQTAVSDMSIGNRSYMITGDISPTCLLTSECVLFNRNLLKNAGIEYPYDDAFDGTWTIDKFTEITANLTTDLNGDGEIDDKNDMFSYTLWQDGGQALYFGMGGILTEKDSNDIPQIKYSDEKVFNIYGKIYELITNNKANYSKTDHEQSFKVFKEGRAYFCGITFQKIGLFLRDMEDDFGILPMPKLDENQDRYQTNVSPAGSFAIISKATPDLDYAGTIIDALAASAYDMITPTLYDVIAGTKNVRDEESPQILQMVIRNRVYDPATMYRISGFMFTQDLLMQDSPDVASFMAEQETKAQTELDEFVKMFMAQE